MCEHYHTVSRVRGEPLPAGHVGVRVCVQLSGRPSRRWAHDLGARLANELVGNARVGHLRLNDIVRCDQIVLEGVEESEAAALGQALERAIDAANEASAGPIPAPNVPQEEADAVARKLAAGER